VVGESEVEAYFAALLEQNERLLRHIEHFAQKVDALERKVKILREENALLKVWRVGRSSERVEPGQLSFFEGQPAPDLEPSTTPRAEPQKKPGHGRAHFPEHLPRVVTELGAR